MGKAELPLLAETRFGEEATQRGRALCATRARSFNCQKSSCSQCGRSEMPPIL